MIWGLLLSWWQRSYAVILKWLGIAAAVVLVVFKIRQSGRDDERASQLLQQNETVGKANEVENDMRGMRDGAALDELRRDWTRK
jgi:hypothetical protein